MTSLQIVLRCLVLGLGLCLFSGCLHTEDSGEGPDLPWNEPAGWENNGFAIPM